MSNYIEDVDDVDADEIDNIVDADSVDDVDAEDVGTDNHIHSYKTDYISNLISSVRGGKEKSKSKSKFNFYAEMDNMKFNSADVWVPTPAEFIEVEKRGKLLELITFKQDYRYNHIKIGYSLVERFLKQHNKILVGGMSIHMAFEEKGEKLYLMEDIDYDFITDTFSADAYKIGFDVSNNVDEMEKVSVISAMHSSTMRVRYDFAVLADVTYVPSSVIKRIETLKTKNGFNIIHPHFQMIDQHRALSSLYENAPLETIIGDRVSKDIDRYLKLSALYPIETRLNENKHSDKSKDGGSSRTSTDAITKINNDVLIGNCISGIAAVKFWLKQAGENVDFEFDKNGLNVDLEGYPMMIISDNYINVLKHLPNDEKKYYRALMDKLPRHIQVGNIKVYDSFGIMISAVKHESYMVSDMQFTMMYLLIQGLHFNDKKCIELYIELRDILIKSVKSLDYKFLPTMSVYGKFDHAGSYDMNISRLIARNYGNKTENNAHVYDANKDLPTNYYPKKDNNAIPVKLLSFNPEKSPLLFLDGDECEPFKPNVEPDLRRGTK